MLEIFITVNIRKVPALISTNKNFPNIIQVITTKSDGPGLMASPNPCWRRRFCESLLHEYPYHGNVVFYTLWLVKT